jgi:transcriptional regulator with XRE-family HTH domain
MDKELTLKTLIEGGREIKNFSQRELARRIGLSNTSLNDLENGKVKKPDIEVLRKIAEELDLSLEQLLRAAGYDALTNWFSNDEFKNKSSRDLKNIIKEARIFKYDILDWDSNKREVARHVMENLDRVAYKLELIRDNRGINYTLDQAIEDIKESLKDLEDVAKKYDYSKLPKDV